MICDICGNEGVHTRRVTRSYGKHKRLLVIENVPVVSCSQCRRELYHSRDITRN